MPIKIDFLSNVRDFLRGTDDAEAALDDVADSLDDVARAGKDDDAERGIEKLEAALKDASAETDDLGDKFRDAARRAKDLGDAGDKAGKDVSDGVDRAGDGLEEFKDEAGSTAREAAASFDGSAESIGDAFQEVAANALAGFGPAGAAAGLAIAAGIGLGMKAIEDATEAVDELQENAREISFDALEQGVDVTQITRSTERVTEALKSLAEEGQKKPRLWWMEDQSGLDEFNNDLREIGLTGQDALDIFSLNDDALQRLRDTVNTTSSSFNLMTEAGVAELLSRNRILDVLDEEIETRSEAAETSTALADAGIADAQRRQEAEKAAADAIVDATDTVMESVSSAYASLAKDAAEFATAEDGALDINRWLTYVQEHSKAVANYQSNLQQLQLTPQEWSSLMDMPEAQRVQWIDQLLDMPKDTRRPFIDALDGMMGNAASSGTVSFDENFNPDTDVTVSADVSQANAAADKFEANIGGIPDKTVAATLNAHTGGAQRALDNWFNRNNGRTVTTYTRNLVRLGGKNFG